MGNILIDHSHSSGLCRIPFEDSGVDGLTDKSHQINLQFQKFVVKDFRVRTPNLGLLLADAESATRNEEVQDS